MPPLQGEVAEGRRGLTPQSRRLRETRRDSSPFRGAKKDAPLRSAPAVPPRRGEVAEGRRGNPSVAALA